MAAPEFNLEAMSSFERYCWTFYGPRSLYPIEGLTPHMLEIACRHRSQQPNYCDGDSYDREEVRDWLLREFPQLSWR